MNQIIDHSARGVMDRYLTRTDIKTILGILAIEVCAFLFTVVKGMGLSFLPFMAVLMGLTILSSGAALCFHADYVTLLIVIGLLNCGFVVQELSTPEGMGIGDLCKFLVVLAAAFAAAFVYQKAVTQIASEPALLWMIAGQLVLCSVMAVRNILSSVGGTQNADVAIKGVTLLELVKVVHIFVCAGLLCKEERETIELFGREVSRERFLVLHTAVLAMLFVLCSELGTLLVILLTSAVLLLLFSESPRLKFGFLAVVAGGFAVVWVLSAAVFYPMLLESKAAAQAPAAAQTSTVEAANGTKNDAAQDQTAADKGADGKAEEKAKHSSLVGKLKTKLVNTFYEKVAARFGSALHPERKENGPYGYHGTYLLEAQAMGGLLGAEGKLYILTNMPNRDNDSVFADVVQTCGVGIGLIVILLYMALFHRGKELASYSTDPYLQGTAVGISTMITVEAIIHIGYHQALLPITGIPLYLVSSGFTAIMTGMVMTAVLLSISTGLVERYLS